MGRRLGFFERLARDGEKRRSRVESAEWRALERQKAMQARQHERSCLRQERETERYRQAENKRQEKERQQQEKQIQIERLQEYVSSFEAYLRDISGFHRQTFSLDRAIKEFDSNLSPREFVPNNFRACRPSKFQLVPFAQENYNLEVGYSQFSGQYLILSLLVSLAAAYYAAISLPATWGPVPVIAAFCVVVFFYKIYRSFSERYVAKARLAHETQEDLRRRAFDDDQKQRLQASHTAIQAFEMAVQRFESEEARLKDRFKENDQNRMEILSSAKNGDTGSIGLTLEALLPLSFEIPEIDLAIASVQDYEIGYRVNDNLSCDLLIHLPGIGVIPDRSVSMSADNKKLKYKVISESERRSLYASFIASFCLAHVIEILLALPYLRSVRLEASYQQVDPKSGHTIWPAILAGSFLPESFRGIKLETVDPVAVLDNFKVEFHSPALPKTRKCSIESIISEDNLVWASEDDSQLYIPYGILPFQTDYSLKNEFSCYP